jgi:hypothetical protein
VIEGRATSSGEPRKLRRKFFEETAEYDLCLIDSFQNLLEEKLIFQQGFNRTLLAARN